MKRQNKLLMNTLILAFGTLLPKMGTFLILPILTSALTKVEYGTYDLVLTGMSLGIPIISLQIEQAVFRYLIDVKENKDKKRIVTNSALYILLAGVLLLMLGLVVLNKYQSRLKYIICIYAILDLGYRYILQICRGIGLLKEYSKASVIDTLVGIVLIFLIVGKMQGGLEGLMLALIIAHFIAISYSMYKSRFIKLFSIKSYDFTCIKELLKYSTPLLPNSISWWIVGLSDRWIVTSILGVQVNAVYAIANKIPSLFNIAYNNFNLAWQESASIAEKDEDANEYYSSVFNGLYDLLLGAIVILISTSPFIFKVLVDQSYSEAYYQMAILFVAMFFHSFASYYGGIYVATKKTKSIGISAVLGATIHIIINIILIKKIGLYAASFSTVLSYIIIAVYRAIDIQKEIAIKYPYKKMIITFGLLILVCILQYINHFYLNIANIIVSLIIAFTMNKRIINNMFLKLVRKKV